MRAGAPAGPAPCWGGVGRLLRAPATGVRGSPSQWAPVGWRSPHGKPMSSGSRPSLPVRSAMPDVAPRRRCPQRPVGRPGAPGPRSPALPSGCVPGPGPALGREGLSVGRTGRAPAGPMAPASRKPWRGEGVLLAAAPGVERRAPGQRRPKRAGPPSSPSSEATSVSPTPHRWDLPLWPPSWLRRVPLRRAPLAGATQSSADPLPPDSVLPQGGASRGRGLGALSWPECGLAVWVGWSVGRSRPFRGGVSVGLAASTCTGRGTLTAVLGHSRHQPHSLGQQRVARASLSLSVWQAGGAGALGTGLRPPGWLWSCGKWSPPTRIFPATLPTGRCVGRREPHPRGCGPSSAGQQAAGPGRGSPPVVSPPGMLEYEPAKRFSIQQIRQHRCVPPGPAGRGWRAELGARRPC